VGRASSIVEDLASELSARQVDHRTERTSVTRSMWSLSTEHAKLRDEHRSLSDQMEEY
ncbi:hypothetical protein KIPB_016960, partial [Kipferlia bialata]